MIARRQCGHDLSDMKLSQRFYKYSYFFVCYNASTDCKLSLLMIREITIFPCWGSTRPKKVWFVLKRGCSITTLRNLLNQLKFPDNLDVHSWGTEDSELKFHEGTELTSDIVLSGLFTVRPPTIHNNKPLDTSFFANQTSSLFRLKLSGWFSPHSYILKRNLDPQKKRIKKRLTKVEINIFRRKMDSHILTTKDLRNFGRFKKNSFRKLGEYKTNLLRIITRTKTNRMGKIVLNYRLNRRRRFWRTYRRLLDKGENFLSRPK